MYAEVLAMFGVFAFLLFYIAEISNKKPIGIISALLLVILGVWLIGDDTIYIRSGATTILNENITVSSTMNTSLTGTNTVNTTALTADNETNTSGTNLISEDSLGILAALNTKVGLETTTYTYTALSVPYLPISFGHVLAVILISLGIYGTAAYSVDTFTQPT